MLKKLRRILWYLWGERWDYEEPVTPDPALPLLDSRFDELELRLDTVAKMAEATRRKVYREAVPEPDGNGDKVASTSDNIYKSPYLQGE